MAQAVADVRYRWNMSIEERLLVVITLALVALGLGTVYSASAIAAEQAGLDSPAFFLKRLAGLLAGPVCFPNVCGDLPQHFYKVSLTPFHPYLVLSSII